MPILYKDYVKTLALCPFCRGDSSEAIKENQRAVLKAALAPYSPYHLLVVPKRHALDFIELTKDERQAVDELLIDAVRALEGLGFADYSIMVRTGKKESIGKSVDHIHYHVIPKVRLGTIDINGDDRVVLTPEEMRLLTAEVRSLL